MVLEDWLSENNAIIVSSLNVHNQLLSIDLKHEILEGHHQILPLKSKVYTFFWKFLHIFFIDYSALHIESLIVDSTIGHFAGLFCDDVIDDEPGESDVRGRKSENCR